MLLAASALALAIQAKAIYVAPTGDDKNPGTRARPLKTPQHAVDVASRAQGGLGTRVVIRGGTYFLDAPLVLTNEHYGMRIDAEAGESPILSAGIPLKNFKKSGDRYTVSVPGDFNVNQLFVDGVRYDRPRLPEQGYYHVKDIVNRPEREKEGDDRFVPQDGTFDAKWHNLHDVEVVHFQNWTITRFPVKGVTSDLVTLAGHTYPTDWQRFKPGMRYVIDNVAEALNRPGQFYFDSKTRQLTVIPVKGVNLNKAEVVAPRFERVMDLSGNLINIKGITFSHATWTMPPEGRNFPQAEADIPGAVWLHDAGFPILEKCRITHVGGYGLEIGAKCAMPGFVDGEITDLGAGGVKIGLKEHLANPKEPTVLAVISHNIIAGGGRVHPAGVGVWIGDSPNIQIKDNEIADFYYTGVSVGWTWGYGPTNTHDNLVTGNHIHDIGHGVLSDMGGVYHLGTDTGAQISGNSIHDVTSFDYGGWGLYTDEGSTGVTLERNVVYSCSRQSFHQHYGKDNVVAYNILVDAGESQLARTRVEDHLSFNFHHNIVVWKSTPLLWGNWTGAGVKMDDNLYWRTDVSPVDFNGQSLAQWQALGRDKNSILADPLFVDPMRHDYRLKPGSPAAKLGFMPNDPAYAPKPTLWRNLPLAWPSGK